MILEGLCLKVQCSFFKDLERLDFWSLAEQDDESSYLTRGSNRPSCAGVGIKYQVPRMRDSIDETYFDM